MFPQQKWEFCRHQLLWTDQLYSARLHAEYSMPCRLHAACSQEVSSLWQPATAIHTIITNMKTLSNIPDGLLIELSPLISWSNVFKTINLVAVAYHHCLWIVGTVSVYNWWVGLHCSMSWWPWCPLWLPVKSLIDRSEFRASCWSLSKCLVVLVSVSSFYDVPCSWCPLSGQSVSHSLMWIMML